MRLVQEEQMRVDGNQDQTRVRHDEADEGSKLRAESGGGGQVLERLAGWLAK